jgi:hypothetical protein
LLIYCSSQSNPSADADSFYKPQTHADNAEGVFALDDLSKANLHALRAKNKWFGFFFKEVCDPDGFN